MKNLVKNWGAYYTWVHITHGCILYMGKYGNRTKWSPIWSEILQIINIIRRLQSRCAIFKTVFRGTLIFLGFLGFFSVFSVLFLGKDSFTWINI